MSDDDVMVDLTNSFLADGGDSPSLSSPVPFQATKMSAGGLRVWNSKVRMSQKQLIAEQKRDLSLAAFFETAVTGDEADTVTVGYVLKDGVLVRKWMASGASGGGWNTVTQIVVPKPFRDKVLRLAHDDPLAGYLGVNKTYDRVLRCFFWPGLRRDVRQHYKACHICRNEKVSPYPLYPVPVIGEPFEHVIRPLPRTKA